MKVRETSYYDYGFEDGEEKLLLEYCHNKDFDENYLLEQCAIASNPSIAKEIYDSIKSGVSYEKLSAKKYIPISKPDFYGYRRLCLRIFLNFMLFYGKWE